MQDQTQTTNRGSGFNRRDFLKGSGAAVAATAIAARTAEEVKAQAGGTANVVSSDAAKVKLIVNGKDYVLTLEPRAVLLDVLRNDLNLTGCKDVDDRTASGADTVIIDGKPVLASSRLAIQCVGQQIQTVESLSNGENIDEVITGFGRMGSLTGAEEFGVCPDIMTLAKQLTNGTMPLGAVVVGTDIYQTFMDNGGPEYMVEFPHGYTYSAHPVACAAALAALDILVNEQLVDRVKAMAPLFENAVHGLQGSPYVTDIRNYGLAAGISLQHYPDEPARRPFEVGLKCLEKGFYVRWGADTLQLAPPFIVDAQQIDALINAIGESLHELS